MNLLVVLSLALIVLELGVAALLVIEGVGTSIQTLIILPTFSVLNVILTQKLKEVNKKNGTNL